MQGQPLLEVLYWDLTTESTEQGQICSCSSAEAKLLDQSKGHNTAGVQHTLAEMVQARLEVTAIPLVQGLCSPVQLDRISNLTPAPPERIIVLLCTAEPQGNNHPRNTVRAQLSSHPSW